MNVRVFAIVFSCVALAIILPGCAAPKPPVARTVFVAQTNYHGWPNSFAVRNPVLEVIVVPGIGRVMSFRFLNGENVFWEDHALDGQRGSWNAKEWINFGGDKTWPAPESNWSTYTKRNEWRPPPAFDSSEVTGQIDGDDIVLTSPSDPFYHIRTIRRVHLDPHWSIMTITTTYERLSGEPSTVGVWVITQFKEPAGIFVPMPPGSMFTNGFFVYNSDTPWPQIKTERGLISITRDPKSPHKMGSDAGQLLWVGSDTMCLITAPRVPGAEYSRGSSAEVYTNPDPKKYIELETVGPLSLMKPGDKITRVNIYTLMRRSGSDPETEARRALGQ